jgi:mannose-6-phosphate isomerase
MYPIRFNPIYKDFSWGGDKIARKYLRLDISGRVAESWEVADRPEGMSVVANGQFKGKKLRELVDEMGEKLLGKGQKFDKFPLLLKILDAKEHLSVQVNPDEETVKTLKGEPRTEMWVALEEGAVFAGLKKGAAKDEFLKALEKGDPVEFLEKVELKKGDTVFIPAGRIHAICGGSLLFEVQQNSQTTYLIYDWKRIQEDGKKRQMHLKEALIAVNWNDNYETKTTHKRLESDLYHQFVCLGLCPFFAVDRFDVFNEWRIPAIPKTFQIFFCIEGKGELTGDFETEKLLPGMTYLIPASCSSITIKGKCEILRIRLP